MKNLESKLHLERISVDGMLTERVKDLEIINNDVLISSDNPYYKEGGVSALKGNICTESVVKQTSVLPEMLEHS